MGGRLALLVRYQSRISKVGPINLGTKHAIRLSRLIQRCDRLAMDEQAAPRTGAQNHAASRIGNRKFYRLEKNWSIEHLPIFFAHEKTPGGSRRLGRQRGRRNVAANWPVRRETD